MLRVLDVEAMLATDPPPVHWYPWPLLVRGALTMLAGREGLGKSMLGMAIASSIGRGATVAGLDCSPAGRALVVDAENSEAEIHRRMHGLQVAGSLVYVEASGFNLARDLAELVELLDDHRPDVVMLDSLRSLWPGGDENDAAQVEAMIGPLRGLVHERDVAGLLHHHTPKSGAEYRGTTAIGSAVEIGWTLTRESKTRRRLSNWKCRPAPEPEDRWLSLETRDGHIHIDEAAPSGADRANGSLEDLVVAYVSDHPGETDDEVRAGVGKNKAKVLAALQAAEEAGTIHSASTDKRRRWVPGSGTGRTGTAPEVPEVPEPAQNRNGRQSSPGSPVPRVNGNGNRNESQLQLDETL